MRFQFALAAFLLSISLGRSVNAGDCVQLSDSKLKPVKVSGAFCGRVLWQGHFPASLAVVRLLDMDGTQRAIIRSDARGRFSFGQVPNGRYRVKVDDGHFFDEIEIDNASATCRMRETLGLSLPGIDCPGAIARPREKDPSTVPGDGFTRQR